MSKKNLPNIPIYIGDWERDCNVLSLESEAAWMRIIFKLWTKGKQNSIKIPTKALQNLWRCSKDKMHDILDELIYNEIADILVEERFVTFTSRRFTKENQLSEIRSKASKSNGKKDKGDTKVEQTKIKTESKEGQNTDIDIENEDVIEIKEIKESKPEKPKKPNIDPQKVIDIYNATCKKLPQVQKLTDKRKKTINARLQEYGLAKIGIALNKVYHSKFLNGENDRTWIADFDWIMNPNNFIKIIEGRYDNRKDNRSSNNQSWADKLQSLGEGFSDQRPKADHPY